MKKVSVIVPVYNKEKYLGKCLKSIINQTYPNIEIIIINDASTDKSLDIISKYMDFRTKLINLPQNQGIGRARNIGLELAQGDYVTFVDADDMLDINAISKLVSLKQSFHTKIAQCNHSTLINNINISKSPNQDNYLEKFITNKDLIIYKNGIVWGFLYDHELINNIRFPEKIYYEDIGFIYPTLTLVDSLAKTNEQLYLYRKNLKSITIGCKLWPTEKILDIYPAIDQIKNTSMVLKTYDNYKNQLDDIIKSKSLYSLLEVNLWPGLTTNDRKQLISNLNYYNQLKYHTGNFMELKHVQDRLNNDSIYAKQIKKLNKMLEELPAPQDNPLESSKILIKKYNKYF